jgi:hypothetical protein
MTELAAGPSAPRFAVGVGAPTDAVVDQEIDDHLRG